MDASIRLRRARAAQPELTAVCLGQDCAIAVDQTGHVAMTRSERIAARIRAVARDAGSSREKVAGRTFRARDRAHAAQAAQLATAGARARLTANQEVRFAAGRVLAFALTAEDREKQPGLAGGCAQPALRFSRHVHCPR